MSARGRTCAGLILAVATMGGCAPAPAGATSAPPEQPRSSAVSAGPTSASTALPDAQSAVERLFAAGAAGDQAGWDAGTTALDASFAVRSPMIFQNLRTLHPARLRVRLTGAEQAVPTARQAELGAGARVVQAQLGWRLPGERADATSSVWLTLVPGPDGARLAGTDDGTSLDASALPLWWLAPVTRATRGNVTVLVGPGQAADRWTRLASRAALDARAHLPSALRHGWDGRLVVEVPGTQGDFTQVLGAAPSAYATTAAVTRPEGPTTSAAVRVVVNPATAQDSDVELGTTLVHETVHVATRSAVSAAPLWAVEGLAEYVALEAHPSQRSDELTALRSAPRPTRLPADAAFTAGGKDVTAVYAQAWLVCRAVAAHRGRNDLGRFYLALDDGHPVASAARSALHVDDAAVVGWWRAGLRAADPAG